VRKVIASVPQRELVVFRLAGTEFALDVFTVREVLRRQPVTVVPKAPPFVAGVTEVRGSLLPVVDLRRRFEAAELDDGAETRILVADHADTRLGLLVDRVTEVLRVPETAMAEPPAFVSRAVADYLSAIVRHADRLILMLDLDRVLTSEERLQLREFEVALAELRKADQQAAEAEGEEPVEDTGQGASSRSREA
jgi:purine-binding chemotaxis protein CheW